MSRFTRSLGLASLALVSALLVLGASGLSALAQPAAQNGPQTYPDGVLMIVNSSEDTNLDDNYLTLREALLVARGELADSPAHCINNAERAQVFSTTWWPADPGAGDCNYITGIGGAGDADVISFHTSVNVVTVTSSLPVVDCGDIIRSNPFDLVRRVTIDGTSAGNGVSGLTLSCGAQSDIQIGHVTIQNFNGAGIYAQGLMTATLSGLELHSNGTDGIYLGYTGAHNSRGNQIGTATNRNYIYNNGWNGIEIEGNRAIDSAAMNNHLENNWIGVGTGGSVDLGNAYNGIYLHNAWQNWIGGGADKRNVISGNNYDGIKIEGDAYAGNFVSYNYIGADANGALPIGNADSGLALVGGTGHNFIGSSDAGGGNVIAGNTWGVFINSNDNQIFGNYIGTNGASASGLGNLDAGVHINGGASYNLIGSFPSGWRNVISGNAGPGVVIDAAFGNTVEYNRIGTNLAGTAALPNATGVLIQNGASGNEIGTAERAFSNLISGNTGTGVVIDGAATHDNAVYANRIGTNLAGTVALSNTEHGVRIQNGAHNNYIGAALSGNLISGNAHDGVQIVGSGANGNQVLSNTIGLDVSTNARLGNGWSGVAVFGGSISNTIGLVGAGNLIAANDAGVYLADVGTQGNVVSYNTIGTNGASASGLGNTNPGVGILYGATANLVKNNLISGNGGPGVDIASSGTAGNTVAYNKIGTNATDTAALPNTIGVHIRDGASENVIGTRNNSFSNLISGNTGAGILLDGAGTSGNEIYANRIGTNMAGAVALPNTGNGLTLQNGADNNYIGDTASGNLISGNAVWGLEISSDGNIVLANRIGTNGTGLLALGNAAGLKIGGGAKFNIIGDTGRGNLISGNAQDGVQLVGSGTSQNSIVANTIGLNGSADAKLGNGWSGVAVFGGASNNAIGLVNKGNVIAGNDTGVYLAGTGTQSNTVSANAIGTNWAWAGGLGNTDPGVGILNGAAFNFIGNTSAGGGNVIGGNGGPGVDIRGSGTTNNTVQGNTIGTNASGTTALPNHIGVHLWEGTANTAIGATGGGRNLISGNIGDGISVDSSFTTTIANNLIGLSANGLAAIANTGNGVGLYSASNTRVGGSGLQYISGNAQNGIYVLGSSQTQVNYTNYIGYATNSSSALGNGGAGIMLSGSTQSSVGGNIGYNGGAGVAVIGNSSQNLIYPLSDRNNLGLAVDLGNNGFTPNDPGDVDTGPNGLLNYPVITATSGTTITGTACANCKVLIYQAVGNPSASGGGANWVGNYVATANASGVWTIALGSGLLPTNVTLQTCEVPCGAFSNTSEFSPLYHGVTKVYLPLVVNNYASVIAPLTVPEAPAQLGAVTASTNSINLAWSDKSSNEDGFKIELATGVGGTTFTPNKTVGVNVTSTIVTGLTPGTTYIFRVRAYNSIGNSGYSNLADAVTTATGAVPAAPDGLIVSTLNPSAPLTDSLGLDWTDNSTNETAFVVESSRDGVTWNLEGNTQPNTIAADINGLLENTFYCFRVRAHNANGDSTPTGPACGSTPTTHAPHAPTNLSLQVISSTTLLLMWVNPDDNDGYHLYQSDNGGAYALVGTWNQGNLLGGYIEGVPGHTYTYKIRAYNTHGDSPDSAPSNSVQMPAPAGNTLTRFVDNAAYPIVSLQIDGVEQFPVEPQGVPPSGTFEKQLAAGQHTYRAATGFWSSGSRVEMYVYNGTFNQQANVIGTITLNNPTLGQILTRSSNSGYYVGGFWSGTNPNSKAFRFYSNGTCGYYLNGALQGGACSSSLVSYQGNFIVQFNVSHSQGTFTAYMDERAGSFSLRNGPADWPVINYSYDGH